jgi:hypothetical protein
MPLYASDQWTWRTRGAWRMMSRFIGVQCVWQYEVQRKDHAADCCTAILVPTRR